MSILTIVKSAIQTVQNREFTVHDLGKLDLHNWLDRFPRALLEATRLSTFEVSPLNADHL